MPLDGKEMLRARATVLGIFHLPLSGAPAACSLIDEGGAWDATGTAYSFDKEAVEETFERVGKIVTILERGYDAYRSRVGFLLDTK